MTLSDRRVLQVKQKETENISDLVCCSCTSPLFRLRYFTGGCWCRAADVDHGWLLWHTHLPWPACDMHGGPLPSPIPNPLPDVLLLSALTHTLCILRLLAKRGLWSTACAQEDQPATGLTNGSLWPELFQDKSSGFFSLRLRLALCSWPRIYTALTQPERESHKAVRVQFGAENYPLSQAHERQQKRCEQRLGRMLPQLQLTSATDADAQSLTVMTQSVCCIGRGHKLKV